MGNISQKVKNHPFYSSILCFSVLSIHLVSAASLKRQQQEDSSSIPATEPNKCPEPEGLFSDPVYCDRFINCWEGKGTPGSCDNFLSFNQRKGYCDYPNNVNCDGKIDSRPPRKIDERCESPYGTFPNPTNCAQYVVCHGENVAVYNCSVNLAYDPNEGICLTPSESGCFSSVSADDDNQLIDDDNLPDLNPDKIKPVKPTGPDGNDNNAVLYPIVPSWPK